MSETPLTDAELVATFPIKSPDGTVATCDERCWPEFQALGWTRKGKPAPAAP